jgi:uncharacterized protein DUF5677
MLAARPGTWVVQQDLSRRLSTRCPAPPDQSVRHADRRWLSDQLLAVGLHAIEATRATSALWPTKTRVQSGFISCSPTNHLTQRNCISQELLKPSRRATLATISQLYRIYGVRATRRDDLARNRLHEGRQPRSFSKGGNVRAHVTAPNTRLQPGGLMVEPRTSGSLSQRMDSDERYQKAIAEFDNAISEATRVSRAAAGRIVSDPAWWASLLFTRLCTTGVSLLSLAPRSRFAGQFIDHYDFSAVASITRNIWECYFVFFYLGVDATEGDEWLTRLNVLQLHDCTSRLKMFTELDPNDASLPGFQAQADELRGRISSRAYFGTLPESRRRHVLKGENALLASQDELLKKMNENIGFFRGMYRFISFHVHSLPVAFYRMDEREQGRGVESEWEKTNIATAFEFALDPVVRATQEMRDLFPDLLGKPR